MQIAHTFHSGGSHPWVEEHRQRVSFGLQVLPIETRTDPGRHLIAAGQLAERFNFDAFFFSDHPSWGLEGWVHLATIAAKTERVHLGTNVTCIFYRHPVLVARLAADLDHLSGGRLILGLGCGWDASEFARLGRREPPARERQEALLEAVAIIRGAWGSAPFTFAGRYFSGSGAQVLPPPRQLPGPPLLIAGR